MEAGKIFLLRNVGDIHSRCDHGRKRSLFHVLPLLLTRFLKEFLQPCVLALSPCSSAMLTKPLTGSHHKFKELVRIESNSERKTD